MSESLCDIFILGAPKCGTTTLASWLSDHPGVSFCKVKEPHYFYQPYHKRLSFQEYKGLFDCGEPKEKLLAEGSVWYLFSQSAVPKIIKYNPRAKFIVCIRNPVEMAVSMHAQAIVSNGTSYERTLSFHDAWKLSDKRFNGERAGVGGPRFDTRILAYKQACFLGSQLKVLLEQVKKEQVHVVVLDDLKEQPRAEWLKIQVFLGLNDDGRTVFKAKNSATAPRSFLIHKVLNYISWLKGALGIKRSFNIFVPLHRINIAARKYNSPSASLVAEMQGVFNEEIELLEALLGKDFSQWRGVK